MTDRKKPGVAFWVTVAVVVVLAYPASYGPAVWITVRLDNPEPLVSAFGYFYYPLIRMSHEGPPWLSGPLSWWARLGKGPPAPPPEFIPVALP